MYVGKKMHRVSSALLDNSEFGRQFIVYSGLFLLQKATFLIQKNIELSSNALETRCIFLPTYIQHVLMHRVYRKIVNR